MPGSIKTNGMLLKPVAYFLGTQFMTFIIRSVIF